MAFDEQNEEADKAVKECHLTLRFLSLRIKSKFVKFFKIYFFKKFD